MGVLFIDMVCLPFGRFVPVYTSSREILNSLPVSFGMGTSRIGVGKDVILELVGVEQKPGIIIRSKTIVQQVKSPGYKK